MSQTNQRNILAEIVANKRAELKSDAPTDFSRPTDYGPVRDFRAAISQRGTRFIFECKRKSPSQGDLRIGEISDFIPAYEGVADAISVLTDRKYFGGDLNDLRKARMLTDTPLLRKDFTVDPVQVFEAYAAGADAVLLMLSVLDDETYRLCAQAAQQCGLHTLTEVHDEQELNRAIALKAPIIGINNRDLRTLNIDLSTTERLLHDRALDVPVISESGIRSHADVCRLAPLVKGFLVGSSLMQSDCLPLAARELAFGAVKICGLTQEQHVRAAYQAGAVYGGLIFSSRSPRQIDVNRAKLLRQTAPLKFIGVFTDHSLTEIVDIANELQLSAVQLHGNYTTQDAERLLATLPSTVEVWSVHRVGDLSDLRSMILPRIDRQRLLLDYKGCALGGNGQAFDWRWLATLEQKSKLILAGGIDPTNVGLAINTGVGIIDVNSGVEEAVGQKSAQKLTQLFSHIRQTLAEGKQND